MLDIAMPKIEVVQAAENYGRFKIEPLDPGYGHTLGNALRRVLLSSIPGSAITKIKIDSVYHEFSTITGVKEDVTEIVLNIKGIRLRSYAERPVKVLLTKQGAGIVRASDIDTPSNVELVNPNHYICTLDSDRLLIEIWTDGTIKAGDALSHAAQVLVQYAQTISGFNQLSLDAEVAKSPEGLTIPADIYDTPIEELDLSTRTYNCLKRADITKVGQVLEMDEKALLSVRNLGQKSMEEIRDKLIERGYIPRSSLLSATNGTEPSE
jgi:DNA-directed RNA polymerase subunit alpha